jgi:hypothetical protein
LHNTLKYCSEALVGKGFVCCFILPLLSLGQI